MTFKIAVFVKQVPDTNEIKWTKNNTIQREGLDSIINPFDVGAIFLATTYKKALVKQGENVEITAATMGPNQSKDVLEKALVYGCDNAVLLSDKRFSGADTLATSYTLSQFIKTQLPDVNLIICGQQAIDGDTAQTPSALAEKLGMPQITNVVGVEEVNNVYSIINRETTKDSQSIKSGYPLLLATTISNPCIKAEINDYIRAQENKIVQLCADDINADTSKIGLAGSPTQVKRTFRPEINRNTELIDNCSSIDVADFLIREIENCRINND